MIRIKVIKQNNLIKNITFKGHANYSEYGSDIVCAAASATYLCTVNAILLFDNNTIKISSNENLQEIEVIKNDDITQNLLTNMINCLESLQEQYPKNINLDKEEK